MPPPTFLSSIFTYPWDLADEGFDVSLGRIADTAGCSEIMLTPSYHLATYFLPHNPKRTIYFGEDGAIYFTPDKKRYARTRIEPRTSAVAKAPGYLEEIVAAIRKRGLEFGAWMVYCYNHHLARTYPEFAKQDALGNPNLAQLSLAPADVQEYFLALTADVVENYKPRAVYIESLERLNWNYGFSNAKVLSPIAPRCEFLLGLCFNPSSVELANGAGMDAARFRNLVSEYLRPRLRRLPTPEDGKPVTEEWIREEFDSQLLRYLEIGRKHATALWLRVAELIHRAGAKIHGNGPATIASSRQNDLDPAINPQLDRVSVPAPAPNEVPREAVARLRREIAVQGKVLAFLSPGSHREPSTLAQQLHAAAAAGVDGATFYNYGLLREQQLGFIGAALRSL